jgi:hypothetical protein
MKNLTTLLVPTELQTFFFFEAASEAGDSGVSVNDLETIDQLPGAREKFYHAPLPSPQKSENDLYLWKAKGLFPYCVLHNMYNMYL